MRMGSFFVFGWVRGVQRALLQKTNSTKDQLVGSTKDKLYKRPTPTKEQHFKKIVELKGL